MIIDGEVKIIFDDLQYIYNKYYLTSGKITECKFSSYDYDLRIIGNKRHRISRENYTDDFIKIGCNGMYSIQLLDNSLISIFYKFDYNNKIIAFELSFIPSYESDILFKNKDDYSVLSKYIRIDYDSDSYVRFTHPKIHLHNNLERDGLRIPIDNVIYPSEFLYLILRYYYNYEWTQLKEHLSSLVKSEDILDDEEKKIFFLSINKK